MLRMDNLKRLIITRKTGEEPFHGDGRPLNATLLTFWQWLASDLISNTTRGRLAEYLVACDLGTAAGVRVEWDAYDLITTSGLKVEVKSAAYLQSWHQTRPSAITFDIRPTLGWDATTNTYSPERKRQADVYVFAVLAHRDKVTLDPLNVNQWEFYILPTAVLNTYVPTQQRISLSSLRKLGATPVRFGDIESMIEQVASRTEGG